MAYNATELAACFAVYGVKVWHVAKTGNDSNDGDSANPKLTIGGAQSAATEGDRIYIRAGTYDETVDMRSKAVHLFGVTSDTTIIAPSTGTAVWVGRPGWSLHDLKLVSVDNAAFNDDFGARMGLVERCDITGVGAGGVAPGNNTAYYTMDMGNSYGLIIRNCKYTCVQGGLNLSGDGWTIENTVITSTITADQKVYGINCGGSGTLRNVRLTLNRTAASGSGVETNGIRVPALGTVRLEGVHVEVTNHASETGTCRGIYLIGTTTTIHMRHVNVKMSTSGTNSRYDIDNSIAGVIIDGGGNSYSAADVNGSLTYSKADNRDGDEIPNVDSVGTAVVDGIGNSPFFKRTGLARHVTNPVNG